MFLFFVFFLAIPCAFGQSDTNALPKLAPPYGQMPPTFWEQHGPVIMAGSVLLVLIVGLALWWICRPKPPVVVPPEVQAREALAKWVGQPEDGNCLSNVSQILRRYIVRAFEFPPGELTTAEFCRELERNKQTGPELAQALTSFLRECDERKFSPVNATTPMNAAGRALALIEQAEKYAPVGRASSRAGAKPDGSSAASPHQTPVK